MSVAYQSWEVSSCPTMGFNMASQSKSNMCSIPDTLPPDASSYNGSSVGTLGSSESFLKAIVGDSDMAHGLILPNSQMLMLTQDNVTRGFSSLSLDSPQESEPSASTIMDSKRLARNETTIPRSAAQSANHQMQARAPWFSSSGQAGLRNNCKPLSPLLVMNRESSRIAVTSLSDRSHLYNSKTKLGVVVEEKPLEDDSTIGVCNDFGDSELDVDSLSSSSTHSVSSFHDMPVDSHTSSGDGSSSPGEAEVQSEYRGFCSSSLGISPPKKGLSRFYAGKSRSFSCLRDVVSVKDLPKPENPYAKKRKCNVGRSSHARPQLSPLQKGVASISKKLPCNAKSTLALAVAMSAKDVGMETTCEDFQKCSGFGRWQGSSLASRSYSLSDLQGAAGRYVSPP